MHQKLVLSHPIQSIQGKGNEFIGCFVHQWYKKNTNLPVHFQYNTDLIVVHFKQTIFFYYYLDSPKHSKSIDMFNNVTSNQRYDLKKGINNVDIIE